jgi:dUTP pyrophosphatase
MKTRGFEIVCDAKRKWPGNIYVQLPKRGTKDSAGYDIITPVNVLLKPGEQQIVWTDVKAYMQQGEVLMLFVRSSIGIKKGVVLANTTGIIDADYYSNPDNDGNIGMCLKNMSNQDVFFNAGERIGQLIFMPFLVSDNCNSDEERTGGVGSTNK